MTLYKKTAARIWFRFRLAST